VKPVVTLIAKKFSALYGVQIYLLQLQEPATKLMLKKKRSIIKEEMTVL
jgi:hypothetical protein